jgi:hypothetical protein
MGKISRYKLERVAVRCVRYIPLYSFRKGWVLYWRVMTCWSYLRRRQVLCVTNNGDRTLASFSEILSSFADYEIFIKMVKKLRLRERFCANWNVANWFSNLIGCADVVWWNVTKKLPILEATEGGPVNRASLLLRAVTLPLCLYSYSFLQKPPWHICQWEA